MRLIDADALIERLDDFNKWCKDERLQGSLFAVDVIGDMPTICDIHDNATNGDIVQMMFSNASFHYHKASDIVDDYVSVCIKDCDTQQDYSMAWWNAPYK